MAVGEPPSQTLEAVKGFCRSPVFPISTLCGAKNCSVRRLGPFLFFLFLFKCHLTFREMSQVDTSEVSGLCLSRAELGSQRLQKLATRSYANAMREVFN